MDNSHHKSTAIITTIILGMSLLFSGCASLDSMIEKREYIKADTYCSSLEGEKQKECYKKLAGHFLAEKDYLRAGQYYRKGGFSKSEYNTLIAEACIADGSLDRAGDFFRLAGLPDKEIYLKLAEAAMVLGKYTEASAYYSKSGDSTGEFNALRSAIESSDLNMKKEALSILKDSDNEKAPELLEKLLQDSDPEIRACARFFMKRKKGGPLTVAYLSIGSTGRRALDGLVSSVYILKAVTVLEKKGEMKKHAIERQLERVFGKNGYTLKRITVKSKKKKTRSVLKPLVIDKKRVMEIMQSGDYDIIISKHSHWYEYTKYVTNRYQTPPLKMKISYDFLVYVPALNKKKEFSFNVMHIESSKKSDKKKKQLAQARTGSKIYKNMIDTLKGVEEYLKTVLE